MEEISIGHQQELIGGLAQGGVVVALIQETLLVGAGLGGQSYDDGIAQRAQLSPQAADEGGVGPGILGKNELEVHIQSRVAPLTELSLDIGHQPILHRHVVQNQTGQLIGKAALLSECGQVHQRSHIHLLGGGDDGLVVQVH